MFSSIDALGKPEFSSCSNSNLETKASKDKILINFGSNDSSHNYSLEFTISDESVPTSIQSKKLVLVSENLDQSSTQTIPESFPDSIFNSKLSDFSELGQDSTGIAQEPPNSTFPEKNQIFKFLHLPRAKRSCPRLCASTCILS